MLDQKETIAIFEQFLNETGSFYAFKDFIENMGYTLDELGMEDE